ncbi:MAG: L,D-transpeptidase family protein [Polyangiaceae bacterium]
MRIRGFTVAVLALLSASGPESPSTRGASSAATLAVASGASSPASPPPPVARTAVVAPAVLEADDDVAPAATWGVREASAPRVDSVDPDLPEAVVSEQEAEAEPAPADAKWFDGVLAMGAEILKDNGPRIASTAKETWVREKPSKRARRIGYLRAGATVRRSEDPVGNDGCKGGWYKIEPAGYVCAERTATLDLDAMIVRASRTRPRMDGLPYDYAIARLQAPPFYTRVPTKAEQAREEPDLGYQLRAASAIAKDAAFVAPTPIEIPSFLAVNEKGRAPQLPGLSDGPSRGGDLTVGRAKPRAGFALLDQIDVDGRAFGLTTELALIPLDRTRIIKGSSFHGLELADGTPLPVAFVMKHMARRFTRAESGQMTPSEPLGYREAVPLTGKETGSGAWLEARDGTWVRGEDVRRIDPIHRMPAWASSGRRWIDVSILKQSLVVYDGETPKYVTLVSTGADGLGDPKKTHSTILGVFKIHTKHITVTMDNDDLKTGDVFDLRDVPFVQYFKEGYALHAAYWHDDFGTPRSHGCVNLAPIDAAWIFGFTTPTVPDGWHAALSLHKGTIVYTHP